MRLSKESEELAELKYELAGQQIKRKYEEQRRQIEVFTLTSFRRDQEVVKLLAPRLEQTADALLEFYFERFEADEVVPDQDDLARLDRRLENIFCGGFGDYTDSLSIGITQGIENLEKRAQKKLKMMAQELKLRRRQGTGASLTTTIHGNNYGNLQQGGHGNSQTLNVDNETKSRS